VKKNNKNKRLFSFIVTASRACSHLVQFLGVRTDIVIWAAIYWMLIVGACVALTIFDQPDKPRATLRQRT
jgi:hypothetical protein